MKDALIMAGIIVLAVAGLFVAMFYIATRTLSKIEEEEIREMEMDYGSEQL